MKKILFLLFCVFLFPSAFALSQVQLEVPKESNVGEIFEIKARVSSDQNLDITFIELGGTEDFLQASTRQETQVQIINGVSNSSLLLTVGLIAQKEGSFPIGPLRIKTASGSFESNTSIIQVLKEGSSFSSNQTLSSDQLPYDTYGPKNIFYSLAPYSLFFLFFLLISSLFFFVLKKYLSKKDEGKEVIYTPTLQEIFALKFKKIPLDSAKNDFYFQCNTLLREYLSESGVKNIHHMTYDDTKRNHIWKGEFAPLKVFFQETYFEEFSHHDDSEEKRKQLIHAIISTISS